MNVLGAPDKARLFVWSVVSPLLSESIRDRCLRVLLKLLEFFESSVLLEVSHVRRVIVSGWRLVVHTQAAARQVPCLAPVPARPELLLL